MNRDVQASVGCVLRTNNVPLVAHIDLINRHIIDISWRHFVIAFYVEVRRTHPTLAASRDTCTSLCIASAYDPQGCGEVGQRREQLPRCAGAAASPLLRELKNIDALAGIRHHDGAIKTTL